MTLRIRTKIILSFASVLLLLTFLSFISYYSRNLLFTTIQGLETEMDELIFFAGLQLAVDMSVMPSNDYLITGDPSERERFAEIAGSVESGFARLSEAETDKEHLMPVGEAEALFALIKIKSAEIFAIPEPIGNAKGVRLMQEIDIISEQIITEHLKTYFEIEKYEISQGIATAEATSMRVNKLMLVGVTVSAVASCLLILYLIRSIITPLRVFKEGAHIIGMGDLSHRIDLKDGFEINLLVDEFNSMAGMLKESYDGLERDVEVRTRELNEANERLRELSVTDGLTDTYNHRYFYERLTDEIARARRYSRQLSVIIADIDYFKHYNDKHGHVGGDKVLYDIAGCIKACTRHQDLVARYGGEEFALILPEAGMDEAVEVAEKIRKWIFAAPFQDEHARPDAKVTISLGVATLSKAGPSEPRALIRKADEALYAAKEKGRNRVEAAPDEETHDEVSCKDAGGSMS